MDDELLRKAEQWLLELIEDLRSEAEYHYGPFYLDRVCNEISTYSPELKDAILSTLAMWLTSENSDLANIAVSIAKWCRLGQLAPEIRRFANRVEHSDHPQARLQSQDLRDSADWLESLFKIE